MKIFLLGIILVFSFFGINAQTSKSSQFRVTAKVDERIELTSIVARLAEYEEYVNNDFKIYAEDVDKHFAKFKDHAIIRFAREVREKNGIGFDAVPNLAVRLNPTPLLTPRVPFTTDVPDKRWGKADAEKFAKLLQQFYKDAECEKFFKSHAEMYRTAEKRFQQLLDKVNFNWYQKFYGEIPKGSFNLYIGLLNGGGNFGPKVILPNGKEELFSVMGTWAVEKDGLPSFSEEALPTIIHEFNHSFINHLVDSKKDVFVQSGEKVFPLVKDQMRKLAYGSWETTVQESLVRAAVIRYLFDNPIKIKNFSESDAESTGFKLTDFESNRGFYWMPDLVTLMGTYENSRKIYPTFRSFMPIIEAYFYELPKRIDYKVKMFESRQPKIVKIAEFTNESQNVDFNLKEITFVFDKPLRGKGVSINLGSLGNAGMPEIDKTIGFYNDEATKYTLKVKLKPDTNYEFVMTGNAFISKDGYPLQEYVVKFKTKK
ncbi:MAG: DUF4932 domain-containing protein [Pyrinomonadaceae bacterium]|nr:DUF4932 domain-containing protein [Pyrinomonadaceae bacterium]